DALRNVGQPQEALDLLSEELSLDQLPTSHRARAFRIRGEAEAAVGRTDAALQDLQRSVLESEAAANYREAALACLSRFTLVVNSKEHLDSQPALEAARKAVFRATTPRLVAWLHARVGQAYAQHGQAGEAVRHLERALELTSN